MSAITNEKFTEVWDKKETMSRLYLENAKNALKSYKNAEMIKE